MSGWNRDMDKMEWGAGPVLVWHEPSRAPFVIYPRHSTVEGVSGQPVTLFVVVWPQQTRITETKQAALHGMTAWAAITEPTA